MDMSVFLETAIYAAKEAGAILIDKLGKAGFREKGPADLVTEADVAAQRRVEDVLLNAFPDHCLLGEESQGATPSFGSALESRFAKKRILKESECGSRAPRDKPFTWIVDPLDGTTNFVHGVPFFCASIGLARGDELLCGVIFDPNSDSLYYAEKGKGAYLNGVRLQTSGVLRPANALTSISFPTLTKPDSPDYLAFKRCLPVCQAMRRTGSTALNLAFVAAGLFDACICQCAHPWDVAAGVLLILESGGLATHTDGRPFDLAAQPLLATANSDLHQGFLTLLNDPIDETSHF